MESACVDVVCETVTDFFTAILPLMMEKDETKKVGVNK